MARTRPYWGPDPSNPKCATEGCEHPRYAKNPKSEYGLWCGRCKSRIYKERNRDKTRKQIEESRRRRVDARLSFLAEWKVTAGCTDCGYNAHPEALEFDHLPGFDKSGNLSMAAQTVWSMKRVMEEIAKCEVVCANCHRIRTATRRTSTRRSWEVSVA